MDSIQVDDADLLAAALLDLPAKHRDLPNSANETSEKHQLDEKPADSHIHNVFEFQEFMERQQDGKTALAALKMIDLHALDPQAQYEGDLGYFESSETSNGNSAASPMLQVEYNPNEKAKRLGRPRKHLNGVQSPSPGDSASDNYEKSTILRFRLDERPLEGPGSRGGDPNQHRKRKGRVVESAALKKRKQALLNFTRSDDSASLSLVSDDVKEDYEGEGEDEEVEGEEALDEKLTQESSDPPETAEIVEENVVEEKGDDKDAEELKEVDVEENVEISVEQNDKEAVENAEETVEENAEETAENGQETVENGKETVKEENDADGVPVLAGEAEVVEEVKVEKPRSNPKRTPKPKPAESPKPAPKTKKLKLTFKPQPSRTTVIREKNRITRTLPGPMVPVHFDLYDDNVIEAKDNAAIASEKLALGFPIKHCGHLYDVIYIISFLKKFKDLIHITPLGPADFEQGLGLEEPHNLAPGKVSPLMETLFCKLLTLVLNRKKPITPSGQRGGIQELRSHYFNYGLPGEWRDDSHVRVTTSLPVDPVKDMVDPSGPQVYAEDHYEYQAPAEKLNPFLEKDFEDRGLGGIADPVERLVMLRCLVVWSLSVSNLLKTHLTAMVNNQDIPGEKDTFYASRPIMKGFSQTVDLKREIEAKLAKRNSNSSPKGTPDPDSIYRYIDPTSDPLVHNMVLRLNDFLVGDCGFHIGRFYLVRMAEPSAGGLSSLDKMKSVVRDVAGVRSSAPSGFKLYVEDVHAMLTDSLREFGVEFDEKGNEVAVESTYDEAKYWHVVASNAAELAQFNEHLAKRLGLTEEDEGISHSSVAYKPLLYMHQYLQHVTPLLATFEKLELSGDIARGPRKKKVDYNVSRADSGWNSYREEEEYHDDEFQPLDEADDDDYDEEGAVIEEEEEEYLE